MAFKFDALGVPIWQPGMTGEERRAYRRAKHRVHAARSRRLRNKQVPLRGDRGERESYTPPMTPSGEGSVQEQYVFPVPGDYNNDGLAD